MQSLHSDDKGWDRYERKPYQNCPFVAVYNSVSLAFNFQLKMYESIYWNNSTTIEIIVYGKHPCYRCDGWKLTWRNTSIPLSLNYC